MVEWLSDGLNWVVRILSLFFNLLFSKSTWTPFDFGSFSLLTVIGLAFFLVIFFVLKLFMRDESGLKVALISLLIIIILSAIAHLFDKNPINFNGTEEIIQNVTETVQNVTPQIPTINLNGG